VKNCRNMRYRSPGGQPPSRAAGAGQGRLFGEIGDPTA